MQIGKQLNINNNAHKRVKLYILCLYQSGYKLQIPNYI